MNESIIGLETVVVGAKNLHWIATFWPVSRSLATRSMPVSCLPPLSGHSDQVHTSENCSAYTGSVSRNALISRSNLEPCSAVLSEDSRSSSRTSWIVTGMG